MRLPPIPLFDRRQLRHFREMHEENMFSHTLRDLVLPPVRDTKSFNVLRDDKMMERAGVGTRRSARSLPWYDSDKDTYRHHADYLKRLSKLREELIKEEEINLANALDRLRMRSYGREYIFSKPKQRRAQTHTDGNEIPQRKALITTLEKFQRMRPKKSPPKILPIEGKSILEMPILERMHRIDFHHSHNGRVANNRAVEESVRMNLQRLGPHHTSISIPRVRQKDQKDMVIESSSFRKSTDANNSSDVDDRIAQMQRQKQKAMRQRVEAQKAEQKKLSPQAYKVENLSDEDKMNLEKMKEYYCIYYIPAPSPTQEAEAPITLPRIPSDQSCTHTQSDTSLKQGRMAEMKHGNGRTGTRVITEDPIPPCTCNCTCRMYVSGNKMGAPFDQFDYRHNKPTQFIDIHTGNCTGETGCSENSSRETDPFADTDRAADVVDENGNFMMTSLQAKKKIRVDMPSIVLNSAPADKSEHARLAYTNGLTKAFKQKELRHKEFSNLMEDVKEINKMTESLTSGAI